VCRMRTESTEPVLMTAPHVRTDGNDAAQLCEHGALDLYSLH
jgi:hypothetical protein